MTRLRRFIAGPVETRRCREVFFWFAASLAVAAACAYFGVRRGFKGPYTVYDDARGIVSWMQQFIDPELFPHDMIADYYKSVSPWGFTALYWVMAKLGVQPLLLSKLLPVFLGLATTGYCFVLTLELLPAPVGGFFSSVILNEVLWTRPDLVSATPRAFIYVFFLGFLYYLVRRRLAGCLLMIALTGLFYPPFLFVICGVLALSLLRWEKLRPRLSRERNAWVFCAAGIAVAVIIMLGYALQSSQYGAPITLAQGRALPTALAGHRITFVHSDFWSVWFTGKEAGILSFLMPLPMASAALLFWPLLIKFRQKLPLMRYLDSGVRLLPNVALASVVMYLAAQALLFRLYLPNRYTQHSFFMLVPLAAGLALAIMVDAAFQWAEALKSRRRLVVVFVASALVAASLLSYPMSVRKFPLTSWKRGTQSKLYEFFSHQPKNILIATLAEEGANLPTFAKRSVLVSREVAIPYNAKYYLELYQRYTDLLDAQYSPDPERLRDFIRKYGVDFIVVDRNAFEPEYLTETRVVSAIQPAAEEIKSRLERGEMPALQKAIPSCVVVETRSFFVLSAECAVNTSSNH